MLIQENLKLHIEDLEEIDKWLISKYNKLIKNSNRCLLDEYDLITVVRNVTALLNDDLSNWYIRRNRRRFWESELDRYLKRAVYQTTYEVLGRFIY